MQRLLYIFLFFISLGSLSTIASAQDPNRAVDDIDGSIAFIENLAVSTRDVWSNSQLTGTERTEAFKTIFEEATDVDLLARLMLGRHYRTASKDQKKRYIQTMRDFIIAEFDKRMTQIGFRDLTIVGTTPAPGKRGQLYVRTKVERNEGDPILADWRVRKKNGKFEIVNLEVEGINLVITNRELFSSRVKAVGLDGLIDELAEAATAPVEAD